MLCTRNSSRYDFSCSSSAALSFSCQLPVLATIKTTFNVKITNIDSELECLHISCYKIKLKPCAFEAGREIHVLLIP